MISEKLNRSLFIINNNLTNSGVNWAIIGSTNLALQGVEIEPRDIDILTDQQGAKTLAKKLKKYIKEPLAYHQTDKFNAYRLVLNVEGIEVEVLGDLNNKIFQGDLWTEQSRLSAKINIPLGVYISL